MEALGGQQDLCIIFACFFVVQQTNFKKHNIGAIRRPRRPRVSLGSALGRISGARRPRLALYIYIYLYTDKASQKADKEFQARVRLDAFLSATWRSACWQPAGRISPLHKHTQLRIATHRTATKPNLFSRFHMA